MNTMAGSAWRRVLVKLTFGPMEREDFFADELRVLQGMEERGVIRPGRDGWEITEAGCAWLSENGLFSSISDPASPCGFKLK